MTKTSKNKQSNKQRQDPITRLVAEVGYYRARSQEMKAPGLPVVSGFQIEERGRKIDEEKKGGMT